MQRPAHSTTLALTALIMAAGTSAHAQFQFLMDQPLNPSETGRRGARSEEGYYVAQRPAQRTYTAPEPERKGFFGRLFSRDEEPPRYQAQQGNYAQPGATYARDGVRYSDPAGYYQAPAPAAAPQWQQSQPTWPQAQPVAPQYQPQGYATPQWPQPASQPPAGAVTSYPIGADPAANYNAPAARPASPASASGQRAMPMDAFSGQRPARSDFAAPPAAAPSYPAAQPQWQQQPQWPQPQPQAVAPQYSPQGYASPAWPATDARVIGSQAVAPSTTAVVPPTGSPRPLSSHVVSEGVRYAPGAVPQGYAVPEGYPVPETRSRSLDRPGFFSRLFGRDREEAPAQRWPAPTQNNQPQYQPQPDYNFRTQSAAPASSGFGQDPFSGQRPNRRSNEYVPEVPQNFPQQPQQPPAAWPAPRGSLDSPPGPAPFALPANLSPAEERAFSPSTRPEDRRYLMYLYAKTGRADMAEPLAQEILARDPANREALLAMSALFTDQKDAGRALHYATQLFRAYPDSNDALYYYGAASQLAGNYDEAANVLRYLRLEKFGGKPFPYQLDLAGAAEKSGDWRTQMTAYQELLDQNQVDDQTRVMVRRVLEPMQREHGDHVYAQGLAFLLDSGQLWQERLGGRTQISDRSQLHAEAMREDVLVRATALLNRRWTDNTEGALGLQTTWSSRWVMDLWAGGYQDGFLGGARLMHRFPGNGALWLEAYANERARDGLLLNSLDGRQHRLTLAGNYLIAERFQTYGAFTGREVVVQGEQLSTGLQGNWGVEFLARRESPEFKLGYRGAYHANSRSSRNLALVAPAIAPALTIPQQTQVLDSLVLGWLHREGVYADLRDRLWGPLFYHLQGSADYAFERDGMQFGGRAGLMFQPRKSVELGTEIGYTTSVATADGASDLWEVGLALRWWF
jgi:tetratricopeptide (TPR) repeat protein